MPITQVFLLIEPAQVCPTLLGYLDPGTGSYALQLILAGVFGGLFALKQSWQQCRAWLTLAMTRRSAGSAPFETAD